MLSLENLWSTDITQLARNMSDTLARSFIAPGKNIRIMVEGPTTFLPSKQATAVALVLNELITNALEHAFEGRASGQVRVSIQDRQGQIAVQVQDDGLGLPGDFEIGEAAQLGLRIVRTLVEKDLRGSFSIARAAEAGTAASIRFCGGTS